MVMFEKHAPRKNTYLCLKSLFLRQETEGAGEEGEKNPDIEMGKSLKDTLTSHFQGCCLPNHFSRQRSD